MQSHRGDKRAPRALGPRRILFATCASAFVQAVVYYARGIGCGRPAPPPAGARLHRSACSFMHLGATTLPRAAPSLSASPRRGLELPRRPEVLNPIAPWHYCFLNELRLLDGGRRGKRRGRSPQAGARQASPAARRGRQTSIRCVGRGQCTRR